MTKMKDTIKEKTLSALPVVNLAMAVGVIGATLLMSLQLTAGLIVMNRANENQKKVEKRKEFIERLAKAKRLEVTENLVSCFDDKDRLIGQTRFLDDSGHAFEEQTHTVFLEHEGDSRRPAKTTYYINGEKTKKELDIYGLDGNPRPRAILNAAVLDKNKRCL